MIPGETEFAALDNDDGEAHERVTLGRYHVVRIQVDEHRDGWVEFRYQAGIGLNVFTHDGWTVELRENNKTAILTLLHK